MRPEYDFSNARKNPYAEKLKKQITINLDVKTIEYFYLTDCAVNKKQLKLDWV